MKGKIFISIKYDLGGKVSDSNALRNKLSEYYNIKPLYNDLTIYNFSYLSTKPASLQLYDKEIDGWNKKLLIDQVGTISYLLESPPIIKDNKEDFINGLLDTYAEFVNNKNTDYLVYLERHGKLENSLSHLRDKIPESINKVVDFRSDVSRIRSLCSEIMDVRELYTFHDFRTIFAVDNLLHIKQDVQPLLDLEISDLKDEEHDYAKSIDFKGHKILANTWSFVMDINVCNKNREFFTIFSLAHTNWFLSQIWVYNLRKILNGDVNNKLTSSEVHNLKNTILEDLFTIKNADLVLKSAAFNSLLSGLLENLKILSQFELIEVQLINIENYIEELNAMFERQAQKQNQKNAAILEFLFAINAIAGIAAFAPTFFADSLSNSFEINLPRLISIVLLIVSSIIYFIFLFRRLRKKDELSNRVLQ